ncbi:MAG TPA: hypothetical protein VHZ95_22325, partial [Polyangiales bacterium]|nr:hypothetical protein [Polyangiales bacterium]
MTQYELLFELDCAAEDVGSFLYADARGTARRLALGSLIDLVASAFDVSGTREPIAFELDVEALPDETTLASLRLQLSPTNGLFVVDFATLGHRSSYRRILVGQCHREVGWPSWLSDLDDPGDRARDVEPFDWPASFAVIESVRATGRGLVLRFALSDVAR